MTTELRQPTTKDIAEMKALWSEVFHDNIEYLDSFFSVVFIPGNCWIIRTDNMLQSALYAVDYEVAWNLNKETKIYKIKYFYALATKKSARSKGYMSRLIEAAIAKARSDKTDFIFLIPAEESLGKYYEKFGFNWNFNKHLLTVTLVDVKSSRTGQNHETRSLLLDEKDRLDTAQTWKSATNEHLFALYRKSTYYQEGFLRLDSAKHSFFVDSLKSEGGQALVNGDKYLFYTYEEKEKSIEIFETNIQEEEVIALLSFFRSKYKNLKKIEWHEPLFSAETLQSSGNVQSSGNDRQDKSWQSDLALTWTQKPYGMILNLSQLKGLSELIEKGFVVNRPLL